MSTEMIEALHANGPHPELAGTLQLFGQFIGSWDVRAAKLLLELVELTGIEPMTW